MRWRWLCVSHMYGGRATGIRRDSFCWRLNIPNKVSVSLIVMYFPMFSAIKFSIGRHQCGFYRFNANFPNTNWTICDSHLPHMVSWRLNCHILRFLHYSVSFFSMLHSLYYFWGACVQFGWLFDEAPFSRFLPEKLRGKFFVLLRW